MYTDRESQLQAIEQTFKDVKNKLHHHYSKPGVTALEEFSVYPDFSLWKYPCAQVIFDSDPAPVGRPMPAQLEEMSQAMIRYACVCVSLFGFPLYIWDTDSRGSLPYSRFCVLCEIQNPKGRVPSPLYSFPLVIFYDLQEIQLSSYSVSQSWV